MDPSGDAILMPKLDYEGNICLMHKILSLILCLEYGFIYRQRCGVKLEL
jgi:hypothetical protein